MPSLLRCNGLSISPLPPQPTRHLKFIVPPTLNIKPSKPSRHVTVRAEVKETAATASSSDEKIREILRNRDYVDKFGFSRNINSESIPKGLSKETIRLISSLKKEPQWMLEFRLKAFEKFLSMKVPTWSDNSYPPIDFQDICYYSDPTAPTAPKKNDCLKSLEDADPKKNDSLKSLKDADPKILLYFEDLGVPLDEQKRLANVAVDAVLDSVSIGTTHRKTLEKAGVIFCSISDAIKEYPELVRKYLGRVVPSDDNYYAALNSAVFSDGSFCYIPKDTKCPMQISTYFRINALETGQFERTLIVADDRSFVEYLEGCTAPSYDRNQLHAAVVELHCGEGAEIKYSTVQNWYAGDENGKGGIYNFVTKRGVCDGSRSKISWTQVETGSAITWKYPSVVLEGDDSVGEFCSVALTNNYQQADTGTKMIHKGKNTRSRIISKGISVGHSRNCYRGLVQVLSKADNARNSSQCDSMLIGDNAAANTYPYIQVKNPTARIEHEASTSKIGEDQLFYFQQRGIDYEKAMAAMISGFCRDVFNELPDEFGSEVNQLMSLKLEGSILLFIRICERRIDYAVVFV
ncbi:hypothetical protein VIGAN_01424800 [Vigna angularis var. angularis]|uniref:Fe-S cluster assembly protein SufB n=1 Tax=Vigna angularis var. angularis TaxID=157739 RepID=A0A0S3R6S2_PHAAN|nr:UPF0051 protein ABCI8, chloroplastic isoform X1 [Vigna angularis]BAT76270.1 hypothetical protein VIGAN_01424800 [Vigna angularis var. angularis]